MTGAARPPVPAELPAAGAGHGLTRWERAALTAAAAGFTIETACRRFGISRRKLCGVRAAAVERLGASCVMQAVAIAAADGLLDMDPVRRQGMPARPR